MSTKYIRDVFYVLLAAQFAHVGVMVQLKRVLGPQPEPAQLGSLGLWGQVLTWGWVLLFLVAFIFPRSARAAAREGGGVWFGAGTGDPDFLALLDVNGRFVELHPALLVAAIIIAVGLVVAFQSLRAKRQD
jgi:hypothetical protein